MTGIYSFCYLRQEGCVLPGVCLSVCLLATSCESYWEDRHARFTRDVSAENIAGYDNKRASFPNLTGSYLWKKTRRILRKVLPQMCLWTRKSLLSFGSNPDPESVHGLHIQIGFTLQWRSALSEALVKKQEHSESTYLHQGESRYGVRIRSPDPDSGSVSG